MNIVAGIFLILHGLVHLLYFGQAFRFFEIQAGVTWPANSWSYSRLVGEKANEVVAGIACIVAAVLFVISAVGIFAEQAWWLRMTIGASIFSTLIWIVFWDGKWDHLANKGLLAILINIMIVLLVVVLRWPDFGF